METFEEYARNENDITIPPKLKTIIKSTNLGFYFKPFSSARTQSKELSYNQVLGKKIIGLDEVVQRHRDDPTKLPSEILLFFKK